MRFALKKKMMSETVKNNALIKCQINDSEMHFVSKRFTTFILTVENALVLADLTRFITAMLNDVKRVKPTCINAFRSNGKTRFGNAFFRLNSRPGDYFRSYCVQTCLNLRGMHPKISILRLKCFSTDSVC